MRRREEDEKEDGGGEKEDGGGEKEEGNRKGRREKAGEEEIVKQEKFLKAII